MESISDAISTFKNKRVLVVGDIMLDRWTFGDVVKISPEAPVPVVRKTEESVTLGGAGNVANNLAALGARVFLSGVIGDDNNKKTVLRLLKESGVNTDAILVDRARPTTEKHRVIAKNGHQLFRLDVETTDHLDMTQEHRLYTRIAPLIKKSDVLILSDYAKGVFSRKLAQTIITSAKKARKLVLADFKPKHKLYFRDADIVSPNLEEAREMTGLDRIDEIGTRLARDLRAHVALTRGEEGISVFRYKGRKPAYHVPGKRIRMFDVAGAGDTVIATLALGIASGLELEAAAVLANEAGAITVQKPGTATLSLEELASAFKVSSHIESAKAIPKVWGYEKWLENNEKYCCKVLSVKKGYQCSLHYHKKKDETFVVTGGHIRLELGNEILHLRPGAFIRIPPRTKHRFTGIEDSLIMEVSTHHDEADSYRLVKSRKVTGSK